MSRPMIQLIQLSKRYGDFYATNAIDLAVNEGDFYALLGPNGAGKTTTIGMLSDLVRPTSGEIVVNELNYRYQKTAAKAYLGIVPQEINLNIFETVKQTMYQQAQYYGLRPKQVHQRINFLMDKLDLKHKFKNTVYSLSGGMKRRLMIARALVHQPKILLLDEPTAGVDVDIRKIMWDFLMEENQKGLTIILTTHYLEEAENLCNRVGVIHQGKMISQGSMNQLLSELDTELITIEMESPLNNFTLSELYDWKKTNEHTICVGIKSNQCLQDIINECCDNNQRIQRISHERGRLEQLFSQLVAAQGEKP